MMWDPLFYSARPSSSADEDNEPPVPPPSRAALEKQWEFRQTILEQTLQHRRLQHHGGMGETGRNVSLSLWDRERQGARHCVRRRLPLDLRTAAAVRPRNKQSEKRSEKNASREKRPLSLRQSSLYPTTVFHEIQLFAEYNSVVRYHSAYLPHLGGDDESDDDDDESADPEEEQSSSSKAVSTISISFSPDAQTMASTHGDHSVKVTCCSTGQLLRSLTGHPRTPWTVKYHPSNPHILASGCLGFQVRVWDWMEGKCLHMIRFDYAIISLSFHPAGHVLAIASGSRLNFWDYNNHGGNQQVENVNNRFTQQHQLRGAVIELEQRHMLRCVHFPPNGTTMIVGGMNPTPDDPRRAGRGRGGMSGGGMSFYLRLWDFDEDAALHPYTDNAERTSRASVRMQRKALSNPRTFVPRALLYNDGGFDVSPDGKSLCACAEYWLPEGVNSAMELLQREEMENGDSSDDEFLAVSDDESAVQMSPATVMATPTSTPQGSSEQLTQEEMESCDERMESPESGTRNDSTPYTTPPRSRLSFPSVGSDEPSSYETNPITPPANPTRNQAPLSPPPPPGLRLTGGLGASHSSTARGMPNARLLQPLPSSRSEYPSRVGRVGGANVPMPPPPPTSHHLPVRPPHPLSIVTGTFMDSDVSRQPGRYVPHVVTVSLDTSPISSAVLPDGQQTSVARGYRPRLGQLLEASPLDGAKASAVTCVKFSPSADFCLLGYGVREPIASDGEDSQYHPVTALYRVRGGMTHVSTMLSADDDVNIARFHPDAGYGFVYGTKRDGFEC